tara:strand:+ start:1308 stop:1691 length:384 start_codon:yes stop_codon:yes gene_type:complete
MERLNHWVRTTTLDNAAQSNKTEGMIYERNPDTEEIRSRKLMEYNNTKTNNSMDMISLYDYLGRAAGPDLGKKVASAAAKAGVKHEMREVNHKGWNGPIMLYPRAFLDLYFKNGLNESTSGKQLLKG